MDDTIITSEEYRGFKIAVGYDDMPENPRTWCNLGIMLCWHRRTNLGDEQVTPWMRDNYPDISGLEGYLVRERDAEVILPLHFYDHTVQSMSTRSFVGRAQHAEWDSGVVGLIFATRQDILKEFGRDRMSQKLSRKVEEILAGEVETYDQYMRGDVYSYRITDAAGDFVDGCGGYFGSPDEVLSEARMTVDYYADREGS